MQPTLSMLVVAALAAAALGQTATFTYPSAHKGDQIDDYHGTKVADPYRWLEDPDASDSRVWITAENALTQGYLAGVPGAAIEARITKLWNFEKFGSPSKEGGKYFWSYNSGLQNQAVIYTADSLTEPGRVLLDPNALKSDGTMALAGMSVSEDGKYLAYGIAEAGSDWNTWKVRDIASGKDTGDVVNWVKFSGAAFTKDAKGFFYARFDEPAKGQNTLTGSNFYQKVYFHKIGTDQSKDVLVYDRADEKDWGFGAQVTEDGKYLLLNVSKGTDPKNRIFYRDLAAAPVTAPLTGKYDAAVADVESQIKKLVESAKPDEAAIAALRTQRARLLADNANVSRGFVELLNDFDASYGPIHNVGGTIYFQTDLDAPRGRLIAIDTSKPDRKNWVEIIPQSDATLQAVSFVGDHFFASYLRDARSEIKVFDLTGKFVRDVELPGIGTAAGFGGKSKDTETFYSFTGFTSPPRIYRYDIASGKSTVFKDSKVDFNPDDYQTQQVFYKSKDGTRVPMFVVHKKGLKLDGSNPTLLYGYGGFNIPLTPTFSVTNLVWMEMGGIYAVANIRGGGEYGEDWHQAGTKLVKQNVFDDFIAAAEFLIKEQYTSTPKLAIRGGSNGGLLIGACMTRRPDLFGACLPEVGVLDMLRFHKFTIGHAWTSDYGSADNAAEFKALYAYSPLHNVKPGTCYPATMVMTADHDDRVVPAHSFKFAATLQAAASKDCKNPLLIRIESRAGHGAGKPTAKIIEEAADRWAFLVRALGMKPATK